MVKSSSNVVGNKGKKGVQRMHEKGDEGDYAILKEKMDSLIEKLQSSAQGNHYGTVIQGAVGSLVHDKANLNEPLNPVEKVGKKPQPANDSSMVEGSSSGAKNLHCLPKRDIMEVEGSMQIDGT